jgi:hypothetical protein
MKRLIFYTVAFALVSGCSSSSTPANDAAVAGFADAADAGESGANDAADVSDDAEPPDSQPGDASGADAEALDASGPLPGFGAISGLCGVLDDELTAAAPAFFANHIDFGTDGYDDADYDLLTSGGQEIFDDGNAGGSSLESEVFAFEVLNRCEGAVLLKTETEVLYMNPMGKLTDLLVEIDGLKIGVSVTRAVAFPFDQPYPVERAKMLLDDKLQGVLDSTANVTPADAWTKQILYILAYGEQHAMALETALAEVDPALLADTIVMVTVSDGDDAFIY